MVEWSNARREMKICTKALSKPPKNPFFRGRFSIAKKKKQLQKSLPGDLTQILPGYFKYFEILNLITQKSFGIY